MRLVFLFTQQGAGGKDDVYDPSIPSKNHFAVGEGGLKSEGYMWLLHRMLETGIVDEIVIFIESNRHPGSASLYGIPIHVVPHISHVSPFIKSEDILWVRGGFRSWHNWLIKRKGENWLMLYGANTGRERWKFWDIILSDVAQKYVLDRCGRLWLDFHKPIHPKIFHPIKCEKEFDICVGASHIHDKKGQWKTVQVIAAYKEMYGKNLKCVMPGRLMRGKNTNEIPSVISKKGLDIKLTGMVTRPVVNEYYNKSKLFVYLGGGGQNDRGPLEALRCGIPIIVSNEKRHHPVVYHNPEYSAVCNDISLRRTAMVINSFLGLTPSQKGVHRYFERYNGLENVCLPEMKAIFDVMRKNPKPSRSAQRKILNDHRLLPIPK